MALPKVFGGPGDIGSQLLPQLPANPKAGDGWMNYVYDGIRWVDTGGSEPPPYHYHWEPEPDYYSDHQSGKKSYNPVTDNYSEHYMEEFNISDPLSRMKILTARLRIEKGAVGPFDAVFTHYDQRGEKIIIFLVHGADPITLTDEASMYPSDGLLAQLRLLAATEKK